MKEPTPRAADIQAALSRLSPQAWHGAQDVWIQLQIAKQHLDFEYQVLMETPTPAQHEAYSKCKQDFNALVAELNALLDQ